VYWGAKQNNDNNDDYASRKRNGAVQRFSNHHHSIERSKVFSEETDKPRQGLEQIKNQLKNASALEAPLEDLYMHLKVH